QRFIEQGGLFIPITSNAALPIDFGITEGISIQTSQQLQARGSVYNARFADRKSPIAYGYDETLAVYFNQAPLFQVSQLGGSAGCGGGGPGGGPGGAGASGGRPSGRVSLTDPDVPQGRPPYVAPPMAPVRPGEEPPLPEDLREFARDLIPPPAM